MMNCLLAFIIFLNLTVLTAGNAAGNSPQLTEDATSIVRKADAIMRGDSNFTKMTMTIVRPTWSRSISMQAWVKGTDRSLILITAPARDKGQAFLKRKYEIWHWIPAIERTIKIPPSMMMQSWMGSDFTNDDLVKESSIVKDYHHQLLGLETINKNQCYKIAMHPREDAPVVWGKLLIWIRKSDYLQLLIKFYDEDLQLVQTMTLSEIEKLGDRIIPTRMEITPADPNKDGRKTVLKYLHAEFNIPIEDSFFSKQRLKRVR